MKDTTRSQRISHVAKTMRRSMPKGFCSAPFTQMFMYPSGDVFVCCEGAGHLGNVKEKSLEELWNGPEAQKLRREFLEGKPFQCQKKIDCKKCNEGYDDLLPEVVPEAVQSKPPVSLDLIIDGTCNIDCVMCVVKDERRSLLDIPTFHTEIAEKVFPTVRKVSIKSGEPFVQKATFEVIAKVNQSNPDCVWQFTTNGQYVFNERIKGPLEKIKVGRVTFSVDAVDSALFKEIRRRGTFERLKTALDAMRAWSLTKTQDFPIEFVVNLTLQKKNWRDAPNVLRFFEAQGIPVSIIYVEHPAEFSLSTLPAEEIIEMLQYYLELPPEFDSCIPTLCQGISPVFREFPGTLIRKLSLMLQMRSSAYFARRNQLCPYPFTQMSLFPDGGVRPCCWLGEYELQSRKGESFAETWNGPAMQRLRAEHLSGNQVICGQKMKEAGCHRSHANLLPLVKQEIVQKQPLLRLDWFFSGKCNLECKSCFNWQHAEEPPGAEQTFQCLKKDVLPYLCEIDLKGGEPFVQRRTFDLMDAMIELNPNCVWDITTNGQVALGDAIKSRLKRLLIGYFAVSIDSLDPKRFGALREKGVLQKTLKFLDELIAFNQERPMGRKFEIVINFVFQKENWWEAEDMLRFAKEKGVNIYLLPLLRPRELSVHALPSEEYREVSEFVRSFSERYDAKSLKELVKVLN